MCRKGIFDGLTKEIRAACDLNFLGKEISHMLVRGELEQHGFHCITPDWTQVSKDPPLWSNRYFEMIPGVHANVNKNLKLPALDDYGISGYKASRSKIEEIYAKIVASSLDKTEADALACKELISKYGPLVTEVPYEE